MFSFLQAFGDLQLRGQDAVLMAKIVRNMSPLDPADMERAIDAQSHFMNVRTFYDQNDPEIF